MSDTVQVLCENTGGTLDVPAGTTLARIARRIAAGPQPFLAAAVDNVIKELGYKIYTPATLRFVDATSFDGMRVLQRTSWFLLQKACRDRYPGRTLRIRHSMGQNGFYCELEGIDSFTAEEAAALERHMRDLAALDLPLTRRKMLTSEVRARYVAQGFDDKVALLDTRPRLYSELYELDGIPGYFYGPLAPSTGCVRRAGIVAYYRGFYLAPTPTASTGRCGRRRCSASSANTSRGSRSWACPRSARSTPACWRATPEA